MMIESQGGFGYLVESIHFGVAPNLTRSDIEELGLRSRPSMKALKRRGLKQGASCPGHHRLLRPAEESFWTSSFSENEFILLVFYLRER